VAKTVRRLTNTNHTDILSNNVCYCSETPPLQSRGHVPVSTHFMGISPWNGRARRCPSSVYRCPSSWPWLAMRLSTIISLFLNHHLQCDELETKGEMAGVILHAIIFVVTVKYAQMWKVDIHLRKLSQN